MNNEQIKELKNLTDYIFKLRCDAQTIDDNIDVRTFKSIKVFVGYTSVLIEEQSIVNALIPFIKKQLIVLADNLTKDKLPELIEELVSD